jgi:hypothetical protein
MKDLTFITMDTKENVLVLVLVLVLDHDHDLVLDPETLSVHVTKIITAIHITVTLVTTMIPHFLDLSNSVLLTQHEKRA